MFNKLTTIEPVFVEEVPDLLEHGKIYISDRFGIAVHLCACGCGQKTAMGMKPHWDSGWGYANNNGVVTFTPSVGNFSGESPYHAHYFITNNNIIWC